MANENSYRILSSGRKLEIGSSVNRILKSGRCLSDNESTHKKQRTLYSQIGTILHNNNEYENDYKQQQESSIKSNQNHNNERKQRENEPTKKLLLQAVSDANKSVLMKLNKTNGIVKVMKPDGTTECLTTRTLAKRLKAKEPTWIDPTSLIHKSEPTLGKMKICIRNEYCSTTDDDNKSNHEQHISPMEFEDDDDEEDEFVVVVNNDYETGDDINNIWMINDYPYNDNGNNINSNEYEDGRGNGTFKRKLSDDMMSDDNDQPQYSPPTNPLSTSGKKLKRCRFWPDCHNGDQCEFIHPNQRCTHFPNCVYGTECLYIHPPCRFGSICSKSNCPYLHSSSTPASSPSSTNNNNVTTGRSSITNRQESSIICKFGIQCMRPNCMYSHPRMSLPSARNYKWVNSKWRASDDMPILPPTSKNIVYENPFIIDKTTITKDTNSNKNEIEK
ncbi:unnamed protein product [Rotaria sp. Silwood1]|nr:unnamed protein product [Rotaria sp. Silwood1]CAF3456123.1 unnamed protein product [Rotaria sp. Silwood1]CAF3492318.1 unnamed protein product [Rotaria sp. Silwood1]CAF4543004.1 unnamed protein product [Rotaria sp. Silwood1]CAF4576920.1 unnamed protein product [Rotaria sp. Silwood1]